MSQASREREERNRETIRGRKRETQKALKRYPLFKRCLKPPESEKKDPKRQNEGEKYIHLPEVNRPEREIRYSIVVSGLH